MDQHLVKTALVRPAVRLVAEVPFAEDARAVARALEHLRERHRIQSGPISRS